MPDRYGEEVTDNREKTCRDPNCRRGWLGTDEDGRPFPCLLCRPHLHKTLHTNDTGEIK